MTMEQRRAAFLATKAETKGSRESLLDPKDIPIQRELKESPSEGASYRD